MSYISEQFERTQILKSAIEKWGKDLQTEIAIEELAELIKALQKHKRNPSEDTLRNVCEEIADVSIMIAQLNLIYPINYVKDFECGKYDRLKNRIHEK